MNLYKTRLAAGLCGSCGGEKQGGSLCDSCKQKAKEKAAAKRKKNAATGCIGCGAAVAFGTRCDACKDKAKKSRTKITAERKLAGQCVACPNSAKPGCTLCQHCIDVRSRVSSEHYRRRKGAGLCRFCDTEPAEPGGSLCEYHKLKYADYRYQTKLTVLDAYGGPICCVCGDDEFATLEIDHIGGGGNKHRRSLEMEGGGYQFYLWLIREGLPTGYRVLCPTCNKKAHRGLLT